MRRALLLAVPLLFACATRNYTYYLVEPEQTKHPALKDEEGTLTRPFASGSTTVMKVLWNDGNLVTTSTMRVTHDSLRMEWPGMFGVIAEVTWTNAG